MLTIRSRASDRQFSPGEGVPSQARLAASQAQLQSAQAQLATGEGELVHEDGGNVGQTVDLAQFLQGDQTVHSRHHEVGHQQVHRTWEALREAQELGTRLRYGRW